MIGMNWLFFENFAIFYYFARQKPFKLMTQKNEGQISKNFAIFFSINTFPGHNVTRLNIPE